jgi:hypothetical protein
MRKNKSARAKKRRGRKQKLEVEFIGEEEARKRWDEIFKLLEGEKLAAGELKSNTFSSPNYIQPTLF